MLARSARAASEVRASTYEAPVSAWANREALLSPDKLSSRHYSADYSASAANTASTCSRSSRSMSRSVRVAESAAREQTRATSLCRSVRDQIRN